MDKDTAILNLLKEQRRDFISGEEISRKLGVSRAAVWKHIHSLRENGYDILAKPRQGYRLISVPDRLLKDEITYKLATKIIGCQVISFADTGSTNDTAFSLAKQGAKEGTLVVAERQTKGRGRLGRRWISSAGGIYASLILRPDLAPVDAGRITLMAAVGIVRAVRDLAGMDACVKWPNDILIDGRKVCGILTEMSAEQDRVNFCVVGFGLNVNQPASALPPDAISLAQVVHAPLRRVDVLQRCLSQLERAYALLRDRSAAKLRHAWRGYCDTLGGRVTIHEHRRSWEGIALDIDAQGALLVRDNRGRERRVTCGDMSRA